MVDDNTTSHQASNYDEEIAATLPCLALFHQATINLVRATGVAASRWLDTGCGTGTLAVLAHDTFPGTRFMLADPSPAMLQAAQEKLDGINSVDFEPGGTGDLTLPDDTFDVITAIQCHHYLDPAGRAVATGNCLRMLRPGGVYVTFENVRPLTPQGVQVGLSMWGDYQTGAGKTPAQAAEHAGRFDTGYHPITIAQHLDLLHQTGFTVAEVLWVSYMQAGFWGLKP